MKELKSPWWWVPTLYFAEGVPYFVVNNISVIMLKDLGMSNSDLAMFTSLLYLPWVIKPLWSPFVDVLKTKRWWILAMQALCALAFALISFSVLNVDTGQTVSGTTPVSTFVVTLVLFYICALASATHDIAADGFYMIALDSHRQSVFVGIRSTFYRIASVFGQGVLVVIAGSLSRRMDNIPAAWSITLIISAVIFALITLWHSFFLPKRERTAEASESAGEILRDLWSTIVSFIQKKNVCFAIVFMLLYRLPEAFSVKMLMPFMKDSLASGGLGMSTESIGFIYGSVGVVALLAGGILGGLFASKVGLKKAMWPMALSLALPCAVYLYMAVTQTTNLYVIAACISFDQLGYGFGFTAYMLYMIFFADGAYKTSHYALCTAFMALSMMLPGMVAGYIQEALGYAGFFVMVMVCCLATVVVTLFAKVDPEFGKK